MDGATLATKILQRNKISRVFSVVGGSAMGLNRAFANNKYFEITYKKLKNNTKGISLLMIFGKFSNEKFR